MKRLSLLCPLVLLASCSTPPSNDTKGSDTPQKPAISQKSESVHKSEPNAKSNFIDEKLKNEELAGTTYVSYTGTPENGSYFFQVDGVLDTDFWIKSDIKVVDGKTSIESSLYNNDPRKSGTELMRFAAIYEDKKCISPESFVNDPAVKPVPEAQAMQGMMFLINVHSILSDVTGNERPPITQAKPYNPENFNRSTSRGVSYSPNPGSLFRPML